MVNYKDGKIYKVVCDETGLIYYGSTVQPLYKRLYEHSNNKNNRNLCMTKDMINPKIYLVEDYPCDRKEQLLMRERYYIENNECCNKVVPLRTKKEYYEDHKEHIIENVKEWGEKNKEKVREYKRKYKKNHRAEFNKNRNERRAILPKVTCECGSIVSRHNLSHHRKSNKHQSYISNLT